VTESEQVKKERNQGPTVVELKVLNAKLGRKIRTLENRIKIQGKELKFFAGDGYVPQFKLIEWREKCFQIGCDLDDLRDAMREVLEDVRTYPKKIKKDPLFIKNNHE